MFLARDMAGWQCERERAWKTLLSHRRAGFMRRCGEDLGGVAGGRWGGNGIEYGLGREERGKLNRGSGLWEDGKMGR